MSANDARSVVLVMLRQPRLEDPSESRSDPFYEFGSFGLTGCHSRNLLSGTSASGRRLAFAQGGDGEVRLVFLTPPVQVLRHPNRFEARWATPEMPLCFQEAPLLIDNHGATEVPRLAEMLKGVQRSTWVGKFASSFRTRAKPLPPGVAEQVVAAWLNAVGRSERAKFYWDALPCLPPNPDRHRRATYSGLLQKASGAADAGRTLGRCR